MVFNFGKVFEQHLKEISVKTIGFFPGKFKPPHAGHFKTCEIASKQNDFVILFISKKEHEGYTAEMSFNIWNIYLKYFKKQNVIPFITTPTPVLACYELANIFNNGEYTTNPPSQPRSNVDELLSKSRELESFIKVGNNIKLNLYASKEDVLRNYKNISKDAYVGKNVLDIKFKPVARVTSATKFREAIKTGNNIESFLPKALSLDDKQSVINILK